MEAVKFLMLPLAAPPEVLFFRGRFCFLTSGIFRFRFQLRIELVASEFASASSLFHQSASAFTKFNRLHPFRFHIPVCNSCGWRSTRFQKLQVTLLGLLGSATCQHVQQPQQTKKEPTITTSWPLLAAVKPRTLMLW